MTTTRKRVLSGMQASGLLHLGNWLGALENWNALQEQYDCFFFVADWHALSSNYADTSRIREYVREMLIDWLAAGIDPQRATGRRRDGSDRHAAVERRSEGREPVHDGVLPEENDLSEADGRHRPRSSR